MKGKRIIWFCLLLFMVLLFLSCCSFNSIESNGRFYSLEDAVENGFINKEDLWNIAYYYNGNKNVNDEIFEIKDKNPSSLSDEIKNQIKLTHLERIIEENPKAEIEGIEVKQYYGSYNGYIAVFVKDNYRVIDILIEEEYIVDGIKFLNFTFPGLEIWCKE